MTSLTIECKHRLVMHTRILITFTLMAVVKTQYYVINLLDFVWNGDTSDNTHAIESNVHKTAFCVHVLCTLPTMDRIEL